MGGVERELPRHLKPSETEIKRSGIEELTSGLVFALQSFCKKRLNNDSSFTFGLDSVICCIQFRRRTMYAMFFMRSVILINFFSEPRDIIYLFNRYNIV